MGSPLAGTSGSTFEIVCNSSPSSHARLTPMFGCGAQLNLMGVSIWEYVLLYCDYVLVISENGAAALRNEIGKSFELMEESIEPPSIYLGGKMSKVTLNNGVEAWSFSSSQYVKATVKNALLGSFLPSLARYSSTFLIFWLWTLYLAWLDPSILSYLPPTPN